MKNQKIEKKTALFYGYMENLEWSDKRTAAVFNEILCRVRILHSSGYVNFISFGESFFDHLCFSAIQYLKDREGLIISNNIYFTKDFRENFSEFDKKRVFFANKVVYGNEEWYLEDWFTNDVDMIISIMPIDGINYSMQYEQDVEIEKKKIYSTLSSLSKPTTYVPLDFI